MIERNPAAGRQCILDEAQRLFSRHGYHGVSIRDIVQACGLSNAALYYHFGNKQNLFSEVLQKHIATVAQQLRAAGAGVGTCRQRLVRIAQAYAEIILESQSAFQILLRDLTQFDREEIQEVLPDARKQVPAVVAAILEEGITNGEIRPVNAQRVGILLLGMVSSLVARRLYSTAAATLQEDVDLVIDVLFEGIGISRSGLSSPAIQN
jgi:AcrR family transcriptional regulator